MQSAAGLPPNPRQRRRSPSTHGYSATNSLTQPRGSALRPIGEGARTRLTMPLLIKICGLRSPQALDVALDSGADLVGFVFFAPSPRHLGLEAARTLGQRVQGRAGKVALTVDANDDTLLDIIAALKPDMLQLHGSETPDRVSLPCARVLDCRS